MIRFVRLKPSAALRRYLKEHWEKEKVLQMGGCEYVRELLRKDWDSGKSPDSNKIEKQLGELEEKEEGIHKEKLRLKEKLEATKKTERVESKWREKQIGMAMEVLHRYEDADEVTLREKAERQSNVLREKGIELSCAELLSKMR